jgi:hypothetical protein
VVAEVEVVSQRLVLQDLVEGELVMEATELLILEAVEVVEQTTLLEEMVVLV